VNILLVEDDTHEAEALQSKVIKYLESDITILGPYDSFESVLPHVKNEEINLALIDIQLFQDQFAGIHIARLIQEFLSVPILFISGITDSNVIQKADELVRCDFLQKPYDDEGLKRALKRALSRLKSRPQNTDSIKIAYQPRLADIIWIKANHSTHVSVKWQSILCVEALDQYCRFYLTDQTPITTKANLKSHVLEECLGNYGEFCLLNRSMVVNRMFVDKVVGNEIILKGLRSKDEQLLRRKLMTIPKERKQEIFAFLGINVASRSI